jgi:hypothetical protein
VTLTVAPVEDILCWAEKAICVLPEETAKEVQQETVRILKGSCKPKDNLTTAERKDYWALNANEERSFLLARVMRPWYCVLPTIMGRSLYLWRTKPTEGLRRILLSP